MYFLASIFAFLVYAVPVLIIAGTPVLLSKTVSLKCIFLLLSPFRYSLAYVLTARLLSRPFHKYIIKGKFKRELKDPLYAGRRLYGLCWTARTLEVGLT